MILVLASASPRRRQLLRQAGLAFRCLPSRYQEPAPHGDPRRYARQTALAKADDVAARVRRPALVLAADTLVVLGRRIFGKPGSKQEALAMLRALSGREHRVLTGVAWVRTPDGRRFSWVAETRVRMRRLSASELASYLASGEWHGKAGAYGIQGRAGAFVTGIRGDYFNVVGLPLGAVAEFLSRQGIEP